MYNIQSNRVEQLLKGYVAIAQKQPKREGISDECDREHLPRLPFSSWDCFYNGDSNDVHSHPEKVFFLVLLVSMIATEIF